MTENPQTEEKQLEQLPPTAPTTTEPKAEEQEQLSVEEAVAQIYSEKRNIPYNQARVLVKPFLEKLSGIWGIKKVKEQMRDIADILSLMPDTPMTRPVKSALWNKAMMSASEKILGGDDFDIRELVRDAHKIRLIREIFRAINVDDSEDDRVPEWVKQQQEQFKQLQEEVRRLREERDRKEEEEKRRRELEELEKKWQERLDRLEKMLEERKGGKEDDLLREEIKELREAIKNQQTELINQKIEKLEEKIEQKETRELGLDTIRSVIETSKEIQKMLGGSNTTSTIERTVSALEPLVRDIFDAIFKAPPRQQPQPNPTNTTATPEAETLTPLEKTLLKRVIKDYVEGKQTINTSALAAEYGTTTATVEEALLSLQRKGWLQLSIPSATATAPTTTTANPPTPTNTTAQAAPTKKTRKIWCPNCRKRYSEKKWEKTQEGKIRCPVCGYERQPPV